MTKRILTIVLLTLSLTGFAQVDQDYSKVLKKMFEASGTEEIYQGAIKQMLGMFKQQYPNVESDVWIEFEKELSKTSIDDLTEMLIPVYSKYLTLEDLKEIIKFYESPIGKKFASNSPLIMQESMQIGQQWGMKIGQEFQEKMKSKGY